MTAACIPKISPNEQHAYSVCAFGRWAYMERRLPRGRKCAERLYYESTLGLGPDHGAMLEAAVEAHLGSRFQALHGCSITTDADEAMGLPKVLDSYRQSRSDHSDNDRSDSGRCGCSPSTTTPAVLAHEIYDCDDEDTLPPSPSSARSPALLSPGWAERCRGDRRREAVGATWAGLGQAAGPTPISNLQPPKLLHELQHQLDQPITAEEESVVSLRRKLELAHARNRELDAEVRRLRHPLTEPSLAARLAARTITPPAGLPTQSSRIESEQSGLLWDTMEMQYDFQSPVLRVKTAVQHPSTIGATASETHDWRGAVPEVEMEELPQSPDESLETAQLRVALDEEDRKQQIHVRSAENAAVDSHAPVAQAVKLAATARRQPLGRSTHHNAGQGVGLIAKQSRKDAAKEKKQAAKIAKAEARIRKRDEKRRARAAKAAAKGRKEATANAPGPGAAIFEATNQKNQERARDEFLDHRKEEVQMLERLSPEVLQEELEARGFSIPASTHSGRTAAGPNAGFFSRAQPAAPSAVVFAACDASPPATGPSDLNFERKGSRMRRRFGRGSNQKAIKTRDGSEPTPRRRWSIGYLFRRKSSGLGGGASVPVSPEEASTLNAALTQLMTELKREPPAWTPPTPLTPPGQTTQV